MQDPNNLVKDSCVKKPLPGAKKPFLESLIEKIRGEKSLQPILKRRRSNINFEKRIAKLECLIKKLQTEIYDLSSSAGETLEELDEKPKPEKDACFPESSDAASAYSCSPCQVKTIIVKNMNFTDEEISKLTNKIPELQNIFDFEASSSSSDPRNIYSLIEETDRDYEDGSNMEEEIDKLIFELKSEICNEHGSSKDIGHALHSSNEDI